MIAQEIKQTNKQAKINNLLTITVSCEKGGCLIRKKKQKKVNEWINNNDNNNKSKIKKKEKRKRD